MHRASSFWPLLTPGGLEPKSSSHPGGKNQSITPQRWGGGTQGHTLTGFFGVVGWLQSDPPKSWQKHCTPPSHSFNTPLDGVPSTRVRAIQFVHFDGIWPGAAWL